MPNRLIKDSIHESEKISKLSDFQFRVWVNLITYVDDYGRGDARPAIIKGRCFPLRDEIKAEDIGGALQQLAANGCIRLYVVDGMRYLYFPNWDDHQRIRTKVSKFPSPDNPEAVVDNPLQTAADCDNSPQNVPLNPNPNPNTESELESESEDVGAEQPSGRSTPPPIPPTPSEFDIPLNDGSTYNVPKEDIETYKRLYQAVDVEAELRGMIGWCMSNPKRRKTNTGIKGFITRWLKKTQDEGGTLKQIPKNQPPAYADEDDFY